MDNWAKKLYWPMLLYQIDSMYMITEAFGAMTTASRSLLAANSAKEQRSRIAN